MELTPGSIAAEWLVATLGLEKVKQPSKCLSKDIWVAVLAFVLLLIEKVAQPAWAFFLIMRVNVLGRCRYMEVSNRANALIY